MRVSATDAGVGSVMSIGVQSVAVGCGTGFVAVVGFDVCPFLGHGAVESLDCAVGLRLAGPGEPMFHLVTQGVVEQA